MALQETNIPVSFAKGLNTKSDPKQVMQGSLLDISNGVFTKVNAINQDPGYLPIPQPIYNSSGTISNGNLLSTFNNQLVLGDSQYLYNFSETTQSWVQIPTKVANSISSNDVGSGAIGNTSIGIAKNALGLEFYSFGTYNGQQELVILDPIENNILYQNEIVIPIGTSGSLSVNRVINTSFGSNFTTFYNNNNQTIVYYTTVNALTPPQTLTQTAFLTIGSLGSNSSNQPAFDMVQTATNLYVLYLNPSAQVVLAEYSSSFALVTSTVVDTITTGTIFAVSLTLDPLTNNLYLSWASGGLGGSTVKMAVYTSTLTVVTATTTLAAGILSGINGLTGVLQGSLYWLYIQAYQAVVGSSTEFFNTYVYTVVAPALTGFTQIENLFLTYISSKAYIYNNQPTVNVGYFDFVTPLNTTLPELDQTTYFTIQQSIPNSNYTLKIPYIVLSKYSQNTAGAPLNPNTIPASPTQVLVNTDSNVIIPYLYNTMNEVTADVVNNFYNVSRLNNQLDTHLRSVNLGNNLNLTGSIQSIFDGVGIAETGYNNFPGQVSGTFTFGPPPGGGTAPPSLSAGTYSWVVTYEWVDNAGNLHRSTPSISFTGTAQQGTTTDESAGVIIAAGLSLSETYKIFNVQLVLYRTAVNGSVFFRVQSQPNSPTGFVAFTDALPDTDILESNQLYTTGGEVDNVGPAASDITFPYKNRLIAVEADNPYIWWYSKQVIQGFPVEFSDLFTQNIDMTGGPISAGSTMDDKLIFFKNSTIFYVIGDGPAPNGTSNDFSYPQIITSDVGCTNQDSIIVIPIGLMFQSTDKGIYLLDRTLQVQYIGAAVEQFNNILVTSAQLLPNTTQVRFTLATGTILIYDYLVSQWSTHTTLTFADSTIYKQQHTGLQANGQVLEQIQGQWIDISTPDALTLTTGWFDFAQLQGYQRVKEFLLLLTSVNATSILVEVFNDFDTTNAINSDLITIPADTIRQQYRIFPAFQKAQSMQVRITEIPTGSQAGGLLLSGMSFTVAVKRGLNKISADRSFG